MAPLYALPGRAMLAVLVLLAVIVQHAHAGEMRIVEAGFNGKRGPKATDGMHFCPTTFSSRGFSIVCSPDSDDAGAPVDFQVDGRTVQRENHAPFTLAGDNRSGTILPWISFLSSPRIECLSRGERVASALIHISCTQARTPERAPDALPIATPMVLPIALPVLKPLRQPRYLTGHLQRPVAVKDACVVIRGSDFAPPASPGWDASSDGSVAFAKGDERLNIVAAGVSALQYTFFAPATASYGVTLDMETSGRTDHNDVWVRFPHGLDLRLRRRIYRAQRGYVKAFHGRLGRGVEAFSLNVDRWSMSTSAVLRRGRRYTLYLSGRSTMVRVHRIILFPCRGLECRHSSKRWKEGVQRCSKRPSSSI